MAAATKCIHGFADHPEWCAKCSGPTPANVVSAPMAAAPAPVAAAPIKYRSPFTQDAAVASAARKSALAAQTPAELSQAGKRAVAAKWGTQRGTTTGVHRDEYEKWGDIAGSALQLTDGGSMRVAMPDYYSDISKFASNIRSMLTTRNDTKHLRWSCTFIDGDKTAIKVERMGLRLTVKSATGQAKQWDKNGKASQVSVPAECSSDGEHREAASSGVYIESPPLQPVTDTAQEGASEPRQEAPRGIITLLGEALSFAKQEHAATLAEIERLQELLVRRDELATTISTIERLIERQKQKSPESQ